MAIIMGTNGHDHDGLGGHSLIGTSNADTINGYAGNDLIDGRDGGDTLLGGPGFDTILGGKGNDHVASGSGRGWFDGGAGTDTIDLAGNNGNGTFHLANGTARYGSLWTLFGIKNFENIVAGNGNDVITGTSGKNVIDGKGGHDVINAGAGADTVRGGTGNDKIDGGEGNDLISGDAGADTIYGGAGKDTLQGGAGNDVVDGEDGDDNFAGGQGSDIIRGGDGFDTLNYTLSSKAVFVDVPGLKIYRIGGSDVDQIHSIEKIIGSSKVDALYAGATTELDGFSGDDEIYSGSGANKLSGGAGRDELSYRYSTAGVTVNLGSGQASGGWAQGDSLTGFEVLRGSKFADTLTGSSNADVLDGYLGNDKINGGGGADTLNGDAGNDEIRGGNGNDLIIGWYGADSLWGGAGNDIFRYVGISDSPAAAGQMDLINDFSQGQDDRIDLSALNGNLSFIGTAAFSAANQVRFQQSGGNTIVQVNAVGNDGADMAIRLGGTLSLQASDFIL